MSGLEALSLACNVMQVITFARDTITLCMAVYDGKSPDDQLKDNSDSMLLLAKEIHSHNEDEQKMSQGQSVTSRQLSGIAVQCKKAALALDEEIKFLTHHKAKGDLFETLKVAAKSNWRKRRLAKLEKTMFDYQKAMDTHLLVRICKQVDALHLKTNESQRELVVAIESGRSDISDLVRQNTILGNKHTVQELAKVQQTIGSHVTSTVLAAQTSIEDHVTDVVTSALAKTSAFNSPQDQQSISAATYKQFLTSFKFDRMNERFNALHDSFEGTFSWILRPHHQEEEEVAEVSGPEATDSEHGSLSSYSIDASKELSKQSWDNFVDWLRSEANIYWICGKLGSGKSTLMKYLLSSSETRDLLQSWKQHTSIISHFFWKPGASLQKNLKGFYLNSLHQLCVLHPQIITKFLHTNAPKHWLSKTEHYDWSQQELHKLLFTLHNLYSIPICIFIDGLDEIPEEDSLADLLETVNDLRSLPNVKVTVASRPEPFLKKNLGLFEKLILQDLTQQDLLNYTAKTLDRYWGNSEVSLKDQKALVSKLVQKSEGVFLWAHLVVRSLRNGIQNGDSYEILSKRLKELPSELAQLYWDMWKRQNHDTAVYRQASATLFNLMIDTQNMEASMDSRLYWNVPRPFFRRMKTIYCIRAATDDSFFREHHGQAVCEESLTAAAWERCIQWLKIAGASMVDVEPPSESDSKHDLRVYGIADPTSDKSQFSLVFTHRTAFDFLQNTELGHKILSYDTSTKSTRWLQLLRGLIATAKTHMFLHRGVRTVTFILQLFVQAVDLEAIDSLRRESMSDEVLLACWGLFNKAYSRYCGSPVPPGHFLSILVSTRGATRSFWEEHLRYSPEPSQVATTILRNMPSLWTDSERSLYLEEKASDYLANLSTLLSYGADMNTPGPLIRTEGEQVLIQNKRSVSRLTNQMTALTSFLRWVLLAHRSEFNSRPIQACLNKLYNQPLDVSQPVILPLSIPQSKDDLVSVSNARFPPSTLERSGPQPQEFFCTLIINCSSLLAIAFARSGIANHAAENYDENPGVQIPIVGVPTGPSKFSTERTTYLVRDRTLSDKIWKAIEPWFTRINRSELNGWSQTRIEVEAVGHEIARRVKSRDGLEEANPESLEQRFSELGLSYNRE